MMAELRFELDLVQLGKSTRLSLNGDHCVLTENQLRKIVPQLFGDAEKMRETDAEEYLDNRIELRPANDQIHIDIYGLRDIEIVLEKEGEILLIERHAEIPFSGLIELVLRRKKTIDQCHLILSVQKSTINEELAAETEVLEEFQDLILESKIDTAPLDIKCVSPELIQQFHEKLLIGSRDEELISSTNLVQEKEDAIVLEHPRAENPVIEGSIKINQTNQRSEHIENELGNEQFDVCEESPQEPAGLDQPESQVDVIAAEIPANIPLSTVPIEEKAELENQQPFEDDGISLDRLLKSSSESEEKPTSKRKRFFTRQEQHQSSSQKMPHSNVHEWANIRHDLKYNHNSVLTAERIEDIDFDENYFTRKSKKHIKRNKKQKAKLEDSWSKRKRATGIAECCICYNMISRGVYGYLPNCKHRFCFECITQWANMCTKCPLCKVPFDIVYKQKNSERIDSLKFKPRGLDDESEEGDPNEIIEIQGTDENCYVCNIAEQSEKLLVCDHCNFKVCHNHCLDEPIDWIPEEDFYCRDCCQSFNLKNSFAQPQVFNAELYEQLRGETANEESNSREEVRQRQRSRRRLSFDESESGELENIIAGNRRPTLREQRSNWRWGANAPRRVFERNRDIRPDLRNDEENLDQEEDLDFNQGVSRSERLRRRMNLKENIEPIALTRKYKPSPEKKVLRDNRGQWRRQRRISDIRREQKRDHWRLFSRQDVATHMSLGSRLRTDEDWIANFQDLAVLDEDEIAENELENQPPTPQSCEYDNPVERHKKLIEGDAKPRFYERKLKHPSPIKDSYVESESEEDDEGESEQDIGNVRRRNCNSKLIGSTESSMSSRDERKAEMTSLKRQTLKKRQSRGNLKTINKKQINTRIKKSKSHLDESSRRMRITQIPKIKTKRNHSRQFKDTLARSSKTETGKLGSNPKTSAIQSKIQVARLYPKRKPCKVIDFEFDDQGKKFIEEKLPNYHNLLKMAGKKVAGSSKPQSKTQKTVKASLSRSKSAASKGTTNKPVTKVPKTAKLEDTKTSTKSRSNTRQPKSQKNVNSKIKKQQSKTPKKILSKKIESESVSPAKHGLSHLFDIHPTKLKPHSKRDKAVRADEFVAIRKIAEQTDRIEERRRMGFKTGPAQKVIKKERSRENEKYIKGKPIKHTTMSFGNLGWFAYDQN